MKTKKLLSVMLCIAMVLSTISLTAFATTGEDDTTLAEAIAAAGDGEIINLADGTHVMPNQVVNKNITIKGTKDAIVDLTAAVNASGSTIAFEGVTVKFDNDNYEGLQHSTKVTYTDCTHIGTEFLYAKTVSYSKCTFEMLDNATEYAVWTYGAKDVTFSECTFDTNGKAVLVYAEAVTEADITVDKCKFKSNGTFTGKAAIELGQSTEGVSTYSLNITNSTADQNFSANNSTSNLWGNKNDMQLAEDGSDGIGVKVDDVTWVPDVVATIGEKDYYSLKKAIEAADAGDTITLVKDLNLANWTSVDVKKALTIDGNNKTITGLTAPLVNASSADFEVKDLTISGANVKVTSEKGNDNDSSAAALVSWANSGKLKLTNVSVKDSIITGDGYVAALVGFADSGVNSVEVNGGTISNNELTAGGTVGTVAGHTYADVTVSGVNVSENKLTSTSDSGSRPDKVGLVVGRLNAKTVSVSANVDTTNTTTPVGSDNVSHVIGSIPGGTAVITGGSYPTDPTKTGKSDQNAAVAEGYRLTQNDDGKYSVKSAVNLSTEADGGYYADEKGIENAEKGEVAFRTVFEDYADYDNLESFGVYVYTGSFNEAENIKLSKEDKDALAENNGIFTGTVTEIGADNFETLIFAKPYAVIGGKVFYGEVVSTSVTGANKWIGYAEKEAE